MLVDSLIENNTRKALRKFGYTSAILSIIDFHKDKCITKEKYEEMYQTNEENEKRMDLSVGEDLESFIENIKNGKMNEDTMSCSRCCQPQADRSQPFLLCLLDGAQRRKLEQKDQAFMEKFFNHHLENRRGWKGFQVDVPEAEWEASESNLKFASYRCRRETYFIAV